MTYRIYKVTEKAMEKRMNWDEIIPNNEIKTVKEFNSYEEAVTAFENGSYDEDFYGVE